MGNFAFLTSCFIYSIGAPFRSSLYTNIPFTICFVLIIIFDLIWLFYPDYDHVWIWDAFQLLNYDDGADGKRYYNYRWILFGVIVVQMSANYLVERFLVRWIRRVFDARDANKKKDHFESVMSLLLEQHDQGKAGNT